MVSSVVSKEVLRQSSGFKELQPLEKLARAILKTPQKPGVYFFLDKNRKILYIGKATNLRSRLQSYFRKNAERETSKRAMLEKVTRCKIQITNSDIEALILEADLIKKYRPPYNVLLRDDKNYFFVGFTRETFPRIFLTHQPPPPNPYTLNPIYIGPFTDGDAIKQTMKLLRHVFPYTTHQKIQKHCLFFDLGLCPLPKTSGSWEQNKTFIREYQKNIQSIRAMLEGRRTGLVTQLQREMTIAARKEDFERATKLHNQISWLERIFEHRTVVAGFLKREPGVGLLDNLPVALRAVLLKTNPEQWRIEGYDISNIQGTAATGSMVVFRGMVPNKNEYRKFKIKTVRGANDVAMIKEVLTRRFQHPEWQIPDIILIDGGKPQLNAAREVVISSWQIGDGKKKSVILALAKREEEIYLPNKKRPFRLPNDHPFRLLLMYVRDESHRFARTYHHKLRSIK